MNIFDILNSILFKRKKIDLSCDDESNINLFMLNRWISMYSKDTANYINDTSNRYWTVLVSKNEQYNFLFNIFSKIKFKRIVYLKKDKQDNNKELVDVIPEFYSSREYNFNKKLYKELYE